MADPTVTRRREWLKYELGGVEADSVLSTDYDFVWNAREHFLQGDFDDIGEAINDLIGTIDSKGGYAIVIPQPREGDPATTGVAWDFTPISVPYHATKAIRVELVGAPNTIGGVQMRPNAAGASGVAIRKEPAGQEYGGSSKDEGFAVRNLRIVDTNDVSTKLLEINDTFRCTVENNIFVNGSGTEVGCEIRGRDNGSFYNKFDTNYYSYNAGQTGLKIADAADPTNVNATTIINNVFSGPDNGGTGVDITAQANDVSMDGCDIERAHSAIRIAGTSVQIRGTRFEGGYGTGSGSGITNPIEVTDSGRRVFVNPNMSSIDIASDFVKESIWRGLGGDFEPAKRVGEYCGMGASLPVEWNTTVENDGSITPGSGRTTISTGTTAGDGVTLDFGGSTMGTLDYSRFDVRLKGDSATDIDTAVRIDVGWRRTAGELAVLTADPTDSLGTGITTNWIARADDGSGAIGTSPTDTGVALDATERTLTVTPEGKGAPFDYRFLIDGAEVAHLSSGTVSVPEPFVRIETKTSASKTVHCNALIPRVVKSRGSHLL